MKVSDIENGYNSLCEIIDNTFLKLIEKVGILDLERMTLDAYDVEYNMDDDFSPIIEEHGLESELPLVEVRSSSSGSVYDAALLSISGDDMVIVREGEPLEDCEIISFDDLADIREKINVLKIIENYIA